MKALIGIDAAETFEPAVRLFCRLGFASPRISMVNVMDVTLPYASFGIPPTISATNEYFEGLKSGGCRALTKAADLAKEYGLETDTRILTGPAASVIRAESDKADVDLVVLGSNRKGPLLSLFSGSLNRSIAAASPHSVLVAKEGVLEKGPVKVVLATDHSNYSNRAIDRFLAFAPQGISHIHVVTAYQVADAEAEVLKSNLPALATSLDDYIESHLKEKSMALVGKLSQHGYEADFSLCAGDPNHAIGEAMRQTGAELVIVGAQGHGFLDRLFVDSVSFHQLVVEPYSVWIVRA